MSNPEVEHSLLGIPAELREFIFENCLTFAKTLYKLPFLETVATNYIPLTSGVSRRLQKVDITSLLTINKSTYFEVLSIFQKTFTFHVNRFDQLRNAVYGYESGIGNQFRHLTVHGDTRLGLHELRNNSIVNVSDWENLRYLSLAADDFEKIFKTPLPTQGMRGRGNRMVGKPWGRPSMSNARGDRVVYRGSRRSDSSRSAEVDPIMGQLINQLLSYNDGCLRIQGKCFFTTFQVYGKKGQKTPLQVASFIPELQGKCAAAAKSGKCFQAPVEEMIGEVKVSIGFSSGGITTARIL